MSDRPERPSHETTTNRILLHPDYERLVRPLFGETPKRRSRITIGEASRDPDPEWPFRVVGRVAFSGADVTITYSTRNGYGFTFLSQHTETVEPTFNSANDPLASLVDFTHIADCRYETDCTSVNLLSDKTHVVSGMLHAPDDPEQRGRAVDERVRSMLTGMLDATPEEDLLSPSCPHAELVVARFSRHLLYGSNPLLVAMGSVHPGLELPPTTQELFRID